MDFEQMGTMLGAKAAIGQVAADANALVAQKNRDLAQVRGTLAVEEMHSAGLLAEVRALIEALEKVDPNNALLVKTGRKYPDGKLENRLGLIYDKAFDAEGAKQRIPDPHRYRKVAK